MASLQIAAASRFSESNDDPGKRHAGIRQQIQIIEQRASIDGIRLETPFAIVPDLVDNTKILTETGGLLAKTFHQTPTSLFRCSRKSIARCCTRSS